MKDLAECRAEIDRVDRELLRLFEERMEICQEVAQYKAAHGLATYDPGREQAVLDGLAEKTTPELLPYAQKLWQTLMDLSKDFQRRAAAVTPYPAARRAAAVGPYPDRTARPVLTFRAGIRGCLESQRHFSPLLPRS